MLRHVLSSLERPSDPNLLVGVESADDAAVYRLDDRTALVQTLDFITPIVDDPYTFGEVAAANSLSDIYAMGGRPLLALNIVCFPERRLAPEILGEILRGGAAKAAEGGAVVAGGHTVSDPELKYGLSVTGVVDPARVVRNSTAVVGDTLVLTKPLGTGILSAALRKGKLPRPETEALVASLVELNRRAGEALLVHGAHAATDVTGFGLAGHAAEMARAAGVRLVLDAGRLPLLPGTRDFSLRGFKTAAEKRNRAYAADELELDGVLDRAFVEAIACDAQTSGGLLVALPPDAVAGFLREVPQAVVVGQVAAGPAAVVFHG